MNWIHICMLLALLAGSLCHGHRHCYVVEGRSGCVYHMLASNVAKSTPDLTERCRVVDHSIAAWPDRLRTLQEGFKKRGHQKGAAHATSPFIYTVPCPPSSTSPDSDSLFIGGYTDLSSWIQADEPLAREKEL